MSVTLVMRRKTRFLDVMATDLRIGGVVHIKRSLGAYRGQNVNAATASCHSERDERGEFNWKKFRILQKQTSLPSRETIMIL